jgi:polar amino acid transport system substrate-binding protein
MKFAYLIEPPFNFVTPDGEATGSDIELAQHVFAELGITKFEPMETEFAELLPGVAAGKWRLTTGLFATEERRALARFSRPIWALPDGFLVTKGNPLGLSGYRSVAENGEAVLAVIRDQFQYCSAISFNVPSKRILIFDTYIEAAMAVREGNANAYASVGRAHSGFIGQHSDWEFDLVTVNASEKPPAFGSFAFATGDDAFRTLVDDVLSRYLGSEDHRRMAKRYGFSDSEIDLVTDTQP